LCPQVLSHRIPSTIRDRTGTHFRSRTDTRLLRFQQLSCFQYHAPTVSNRFKNDLISHQMQFWNSLSLLMIVQSNMRTRNLKMDCVKQFTEQINNCILLTIVKILRWLYQHLHKAYRSYVGYTNIYIRHTDGIFISLCHPYSFIFTDSVELTLRCFNIIINNITRIKKYPKYHDLDLYNKSNKNQYRQQWHIPTIKPLYLHL
jgi:hypothetical protein